MGMREGEGDGLIPLKSGDTVCILGGGPGGSACALALMQEGRRQGIDLKVVLFEQKRFKEHTQYNQCIGVLSPPLETTLREMLGLSLPPGMAKKEMAGYCLHGDRLDLPLTGEETGHTWAVSRADFDEFLCDRAIEAGVEVINNRVTGIEISAGDVLVYSEGRNCRAAAVVGAFGLDDGSAALFEEATAYRRPDHLNTIITRLYPGDDFLKQMGPVIHAFLLSFEGLEFGAVTPKQDHLSINIAGRNVSSRVMLNFLRSAPVQRLLPPQNYREKPLHYFRGKFPICPARNLFGHRYVTIGDAAGLMRPFKGKGINSAILTGVYAARTMVRLGVSRKAFQSYIRDCSELTGDLWYGRALRFLTNLSTRFQFMDRLLKIGGEDPVFMACLFNSVSGHLPYKTIVRQTATFPVAIKIVRELVNRFVLHTSLRPGPRSKKGEAGLTP